MLRRTLDKTILMSCRNHANTSLLDLSYLYILKEKLIDNTMVKVNKLYNIMLTLLTVFQ